MSELKAADIARRHGIDRKTAYRWLVALEREYGSRVVTRRGRVLVTTEDAFREVAPLAAERSAQDRRFREIEERLDDGDRRVDKLAERMSAVEREVRR